MARPQQINRYGSHDIEIVWDDGRRIVYPARPLRLACPCAMCQDEMTGERIITDSALPILTYPTKIEPVGAYAIQIHWSDNHSTGIYTWEKLSELADTIGKSSASEQQP